MKKTLFRIVPLMMTLIALLLLVTACGHEHSYGEWAIEKDATCTGAGIKVRVCECGETETANISAKGHTDGEWIVDADATCTENGSKHQVCSVCTETIKTESISAKGHVYGEWIVDYDATCTENGSKHQVCSNCKTNMSEIIFAKGHSWTSATCSFPSTCSNCLLTKGTTSAHNFISGKCSYCGASDITLTNTYGGRQYVAYYYAYSTGRTDVKGTGYIEEFTYDGNKLKVVVTIAQPGTFAFNYKITDSNGITVENSYMIKMNTCVGERYILEARLNLSPGEYMITFSSKNALS